MIDKEETNVGAHAIFVTKDGKLILQQRDNKKGIAYPGLISVFGGTLRLNELLEEGLKREILEETEVDCDKHKVWKLGTFIKTKELDGMDRIVNMFIIEGVDPEDIKIHEGSGYVTDKAEQLLKLDKLTRITRLAIEKYIEKSGNWS